MEEADNKKSKEDIKALLTKEGVSYMRTLTIHEKTLKKTGEVVFFIRPTINKKTYYVEFKSKEDAEQFLSITPLRTTSPTRRKFFDHFFDVLNGLTRNSTKSNWYYLQKRFSPIMRKSLDEITEAEVNAIFKASPKSTWATINAVLSTICKNTENPNLISIHKETKVTFKSKQNRRVVRKPEDLLNKLLDYQPQDHRLKKARLIALILGFTGMRIGEFLALKEEDWHNEKLVISKVAVSQFSYSKRTGEKGKSQTIVENGTKSGEYVSRSIDIPDEVLTLANEYYALLGTLGSRKLQQATKIRRMVRDLGKEIGIEKLHPHLLRHAYGTIFGKQCKDMKELIQLQNTLGHADIETTLRYLSIEEADKDAIKSKFPMLNKVKTS